AAERAFGGVAAEDNSCAIAAWGFASILMSNPLGGIGAPPKNAPRAQAAIDKGRQMGAKTERERDYLEAVAAYYEDFANRPERARQLSRAKAYEALAAKYPGDDEAQIFYALHALDYMTYAYLQLGRDGEARKTLDEARTLTEINPARATAPYALAAMPARYAVERSAWGDAVKLAPSPSRYPFTEAMTHFARALGAARSGDPAAAQKDAERIAALRDELKAAKNEYWANEVEVMRLAS